ncbi:ABC transporter ATP-binding protein [Geosporobacter ferrireducens]|uniref:Iron ABC transporter ATP-binding protein n=1 Tax=Geosporobacter ferrireducens TaxID=1424294 RepID=A0A1D8GG02_9FIRM|nr:ABC transporter ATP-binding protein [Geosporobacter ferrireducens]AOT69846.1 iron ABC transporter ATP-binding protein [Geosporobacter ferrireducens]MTI54459.1 ABC transporter ATP-binding protein [Geosporobacter ferrireducens]
MEIRDLSFQYEKQLILKSISAPIQRGKITTIIGPNGCGKSTLFHLMTKNLKPLKGGIYLDNKNIKDIGLKDFSKKVAIVHQYNTAPRDITVKTLVAYGRTPHLPFYRKINEEDEAIIDWAMKITEIDKMKDREIVTLSGGQKQRVFIAMALAQKTDILFLDEPTTYLDVRYQIQILDLIQRLNKDFGMTIVMVLHDINQAICYSDEIIGLKDGTIVVQGSTDRVINRKTLYDIFNIHLKVLKEKDRKYVVPVSEEKELLSG